MGWLQKIGKVLSTAKDVAPLLSLFGVPGAKTISEAVDKIHGDADRSNDDAVALLAASVDVLERRVLSLEKDLKALGAKVK